MKCSTCGSTFNDGVQCGVCKKHLDFGCAQITETGWRKLGNERRAAWKCSTCRTLSPTPPAPVGTSEPASLEAVLKEVRDLKRHLLSLPTLIDDVKSIKDELKDLRSGCDFINNRLEGFNVKFTDIENRVTNIELLQKTVASMETTIASLSSQICASDQRSRLNNVEIKGVPFRREENLFSLVESISKVIDHSFSKSQINYLNRAPLHGSKDKTIIVSFINRYVKEEFIAYARACKTLSAADIGFSGVNQRIFVNDHLNATMKTLLNKTKSLAKEKKYNYVWVKYGKIHIRKNDTSPAFVVSRETDLNKIA